MPDYLKQRVTTILDHLNYAAGDLYWLSKEVPWSRSVVQRVERLVAQATQLAKKELTREFNMPLEKIASTEDVNEVVEILRDAGVKAKAQGSTLVITTEPSGSAARKAIKALQKSGWKQESPGWGLLSAFSKGGKVMRPQYDGNTAKWTIKSGSDALKVASQLPKGDPVRRQILAALKTGGIENPLWWILDHNKFAQLYSRMLKERDEQSAELLRDIVSVLEDALSLSRGEREAVGRLKDCVDNARKWDAALLRNNIFKAAHAMGLKLPSAMF